MEQRIPNKKPVPHLLAACILSLLLLRSVPCPAAAPPGTPMRPSQPTASLDAYEAGLRAWATKDRAAAIRHWQEARRLDPQSVPPRLALARALMWSDPSNTSEVLGEISFLVLTDFHTQRWLVRNVLLALALGGTLGVFLLSAGLIARHLGAVHHVVREGIIWSLPVRRSASSLAWALLALPVLMGIGPVAAVLLLVFLCAFRFGRAERILALGCAAWALLLGPALLVSAPLWSSAPDGRDALLIDSVQREPSAPSSRLWTAAWLHEEPHGPIPLFLDGLSRLELKDGAGAATALTSAEVAAEIPPAVLETDLGNAAFLQGDSHAALARYRRALGNDPSCFEAMYNLGLLQAGEGRFAQADEALDAAARLNLDRLRALGRSEDVSGPRSPVQAIWPAPALWAWTLRHPHPALPPRALLQLLPLRNLRWAAPLILAVVLLGTLVGRHLSRLLRVRVCYQCGAPVCRRCLRRIDRRAYCRKCGESLGGLETGESTRRLLQKLVEDKPGGAQIGRLLSYVVPGAGAVVRGYPLVGAVASATGGIALALLAFPLWGMPYLRLPSDPLMLGAIRGIGILLLLLALGITALGTRAADRRRGSLRAFLDRDVDRLAA